MAIRSPTRWFVVGLMCAVFLGGLAAAIAGTTLPAATRLAIAALAVGALGLAYQASKWSITCDESGVTAINEYGRLHLSWDVIARFEQRGLGGIGVVRSDNKKWSRLMFYATFGDISEERATELLDRERKAHQSNESTN